MKKTKKILVAALAVVMIVALSVGATLAYLTDSTSKIQNTFTVGKVDIDLSESPDLDLKLIPGKTITKDPVVTVMADSEDCWLFVKIDESNWPADGWLTYAVAEGWNQLETGVYYREVSAAAADQEFHVLASDQVLVNASATSAQIAAAGENAPKLDFTAYAVQYENVANAAAAWAILNP